MISTSSSLIKLHIGHKNFQYQWEITFIFSITLEVVVSPPFSPVHLSLDNYAKWYRYPVGNEAETIEILDENDYVKDAPYFYIGVFAPTADGRYLAFNYDIVGDESYTLVIR